MTAPVLPPTERPNYFTGEALLTDDFTCEQRYHIDSLAAMNGTLHTFGIAAGLDVQWFRDSQPRQVHVAPGMAIDRLGRQIVLAQPELVVFDDVVAGASYYLTIDYAEVYGDLTDDNGVRGYKRVIQQPRIAYDRAFDADGTAILLAVVTLSNDAAIADLTHRAGRDERRYVGGRFGSLALVTEGAGLLSAPASDTATTAVELLARHDSGDASYLQVNAPRSQFAGPLATRTAIGIGIDHPTATLDLTTPTLKGGGTFTTKATVLTLTDPVTPPLQPGDRITPDVSLALPQPSPGSVAIVRAVSGSDGRAYEIDRPFSTDITRPTRFTYRRDTMLRIVDPDHGALLSVGRDGRIDIGVRAGAAPGSTTPGPGALSIGPDRRVGIGLTGATTPQASLQVAGGLIADAVTTDRLLSTGSVTAQSFIGNGSGLTNLSFLSYWTKADVTAATSPLYYNDGNVGVHMAQPLGSLSAGTRGAVIGDGLISSDPNAPNKVKGVQTAFTRQVAALVDSITLGSLVEQRRTITGIAGDGQLTIDSQFPIVLLQSAYKTLPAHDTGSATAGPGTISSNGTTITGSGTSFRSLAVGDLIVIDAFVAFDDQRATRLVVSVDGDTDLTLQDLAPGEKWEANMSAYMISSGLMGYFQASDAGTADAGAPPPALIVHYNGANATGADVANTVAINVPLSDIDATYALQVNGPFSQGGGSASFADLTVTQTLTVSGDGTATNLLAVGENGASPLLTVTKTNVEVAQSSGGSGPALSITGDAQASGTLSANAVTGTTVASTAAMTCGGLLGAQALSVQGVSVGADRSVSLFGPRVAYGDANLINGTFSAQAATDGFVQIFLGTPSENFDKIFAGKVAVTTLLNQSPTSATAAAAWTEERHFSVGKKGDAVIQVPTYGTLTVPVRKGETWQLVKTVAPDAAGIPAAQLVFWWIPLGPGTAGLSAAPDAPNLQDLAATFERQHANVLAGTVTGSVDAAGLAAAQADIDRRVGDLTRILGDATQMKPDDDARSAFQRDLAEIVCRAGPPAGDVPPPVPDTAIDRLVTTFARVTGRTVSAEQRDLLAKGVRALVEINDSASNRSDLSLIRGNIDYFITNMETALGTVFAAGPRRLLTRALVRLVGDGSQSIDDAPPPAPPGDDKK